MRRLLFLLLALPVAAGAQDWATLAPGLGPAVVVGEPLAPWAVGPGVAVRVEAPAYGGRARAELRAFAFAADAPDFPDFVLLVPTVGWGPGVTAGPVRLGAGARVGVAQFRFDDPEAGNFQNELEAAVGAWAGASATVGRVEVWAEADAVRVALAEPATLVGVTGGVAVRLATPRWLRRVLE